MDAHRTSSHAEYLKWGAGGGGETGGARPEYNGDLLAEYRAARHGVALADLSHQGALLVSGPDRTPFLQNLISNDLNLLTETQGIYSALLSAKGRVIADFFIYSQPDAYLIELEWVPAQTLLTHLLRYRFRSKVTFSTPPWGKLLLAGPRAGALLAAFLGVPPPTAAARSCFQPPPLPLAIRRAIACESDALLYLPEARLPEVWGRLLTLGATDGVRPIGQTTLETLRIEAGRPRHGADMDDQTLAIEAGLSAAISLSKGCYPGQEVMARIDTYGHVNRHLRGLYLAGGGVPGQGASVFHEEEEVGRVTSVAESPTLGPIALAYLRTPVAEPGTAVVVHSAHTRWSAKVSALPFALPTP